MGGGSGGTERQEEELRKEFNKLVQTLVTPEEVMSKEDIKRLKDAAFGPLTYWVVETRPIQEADRTGTLIRGNLRDDREKVFQIVKDKLRVLFNGKYEVIMVEDPDAESTEEARADEAANKRRQAQGGPPSSASGASVKGLLEGQPVAFQIIPASQALPLQTNGFRIFSAGILGLLTVGSSLQLALAANITKLPKETLEYFSNPDNANNADQLAPGLENWDPTNYIETALPILAAVLAVQLFHETGHRIAAGVRGVKLGPSYFVPFGQVGSLGAITPFTSLVKDHKTLWDVAAAGPLAGALASASLLLLGLAQSHGALDQISAAEAIADAQAIADATASLVPVPTDLFQGSFLLGGLTRAVLGEQAMRAGQVFVSPLAIAGWCGLLTTALNVLPCGSLDGGRMIQATFGRKTLALTSFFTYVGLGLGLLGSSLALPFGLYVILCQRTAEKYIQDNVTPAGGPASAITLAAVAAAILILLPVPPELADTLVGTGVNASNPFL